MKEHQQPTAHRTAKQTEVLKEDMEKKNACKRKLRENFKKVDYFGQSVSFTWNGEDQFKTTFGASISFVLLLILLGYGLNKLVETVERKSPSVTVTTMNRDPSEDFPFSPQDSGFDFAFGIDSNNFDTSLGFFTARFVHSYFNEQGIRIKDVESMPFTKCGRENFDYPDQDEVEKFGISNMFCLNNSDYQLQGNFYRSEMRYVELKLWKCVNATVSKFNHTGVVCQNQTTIDNFFDSQKFSLAFVNNLFEVNNFEDPVSPFIDDSLFFELDSQIIKKANFFVQQNNASLQDNIFPLAEGGGDIWYHSVKNIRTYDDHYSTADGYIIGIYIRYDRSFDIITRQVYDLLTLLGDIGGLQGSLIGIGMVFVSFITSKMFMSKIVRKIYQIRKYENFEGADKKQNKVGVHSKKPDIEQSSQRKLGLYQHDTTGGKQTDQEDSQIELDKMISLGIKEKEQYLQSDFRSKNEVHEKDVGNILFAFINRTRFKYTIKDILNYILQLMCIRSVDKFRRLKAYKRHFLFAKAEEKFSQELDVVRIVKTLRKFKMFAQAMLSQKHRLILRFQRQNLIETSSSSSDSDDNRFDTVRLMENQNPLIRLVMFGKLKKMMMQFTGKQVEPLERNMMRGLFIRKLKDFAEDQKNIQETQTLFSRLMTEMKMSESNEPQALIKATPSKNMTVNVKFKNSHDRDATKRQDQNTSLSAIYDLPMVHNSSSDLLDDWDKLNAPPGGK